MSKKTGIAAAALIAVMACAAVIAVIGNRPSYAGNEHHYEYAKENEKMLKTAVKINDKYAGRIIDLFEQFEPGCRFVSVEDSGELDGGIRLYITTDSGKRYSVNTSTNGELANITDLDTGKMLYPSGEPSEEDDEDDSYVDIRSINKDMLATCGIEQGSFTKQDAEKVEEGLNRAAPGELIKGLSVEVSDGNKIFHIETDTGKAFDITIDQDGDTSVIEQ